MSYVAVGCCMLLPSVLAITLACFEFAVSSNHYQRRGMIEEQNALKDKNNIQWVKSTTVPKDAFSYYDKKLNKFLYIARNGCQLCYVDGTKAACVTQTSPEMNTYAPFTGDVEYLVNENDFEILEWKLTTYGDIPPLAVKFCDELFIVKTEGGLGYIKTEGAQPKISLAEKDAARYKILTLNRDIEEQYLSNVNFDLNPSKTSISQDQQVLKQYTTVNNNCNSVKQQAKFEKTIETTMTIQTQRSKTIGIPTEFTGKIPVIGIGVKLGLSGNRVLTFSRSSSTTEKNIHFLTTEIEVPPNNYCSVMMTGVSYETKVTFTGTLTRLYKNKELRQTPVSGIYSSQEVMEMKAIVDLCKEVQGPVKCRTSSGSTLG